MKEEWLDKLQTRIQNEYDVKAPDGLLDDIRQEMRRRGAEPARRRAAAVPLWTVPAAAAVVGIGLFLTRLLPVDSPPHRLMPPTDGRQAIALPAVTATADGAQTAAGSTMRRMAAADLHRQGQAEHCNVTAITLFAGTEKADGDNGSGADISGTETGSRIGTPSANGERQPEKPHAWMPSERTAGPDAKSSSTAARPAVRPSRLRIGTSCNYGRGASAASDRILLAVANPYGDYAPEFAGRNVSDRAIGAKDTRTAAKHHQPLRLGISLRYDLGSRWSMQAGVSYSRLASDFTYNSAGTEYVVKQKLQYVGLPVSAAYSFVRTQHFELYAAAGAEVEKLVKGEASRSGGAAALPDAPPADIRESRPVFSTSLSLGAEVRVGKAVSAYVEPGISHYFNNGSDIENLYKERPTGFNLNMGIRINVNR